MIGLPSMEVRARVVGTPDGWNNSIVRVSDAFPNDTTILLTKDYHIDDLIEFTLAMLHTMDSMYQEMQGLQAQITELKNNPLNMNWIPGDRHE